MPSAPRPRRARARLALVLLLPLLLGACGDDPVSAAALPRCGTDALNITVSGALEPVIRWTPACRAHFVRVSRAVGPFLVAWDVASDTATLVPGVRYGHTPAGARVVTESRPLGADTSYYVDVGRLLQPSLPGASTSIATRQGITVCGGPGDGCRTSLERFADVTAEGVRFTAAVSAASIQRGDTAWLTFTASNPSSQPVTIEPQADCWRERVRFVDAAGRSAFGPSIGECSPFGPPAANVTIGALETRVSRLAFTGDLWTVPPGMMPIVSCLAAGTWTAQWEVNAANGGLRVRSNAVTIALRERAGASACGAGG